MSDSPDILSALHLIVKDVLKMAQANGWIIVEDPSKKDLLGQGDCVLYIESGERKTLKSTGEDNLPPRPSDGSVRKTVASGWFDDDLGFPEFAQQPWYALRERIGKVVTLDNSWCPASCRFLFDGLTNCEEFDLLNLDTSKSDSLCGMFRGCSSVKQLLDIDRFNTSLVTDSSYMFLNCLKLRAVSVSGWDTSHIENTEQMLAGCAAYVLADEEQLSFLNRITSTQARHGVWRKMA